MNCEKLVRMKVGDLKALLRQTDRTAKGVAKMTKPELIGRLTGGAGAVTAAPSRPTLKRPVYDRRKERGDAAPRSKSDSPMPGTPPSSLRRPTLVKPDRSARDPRGISTPAPTPPRPKPKLKKAVPRPRLITPNMTPRSGGMNTPEGKATPVPKPHRPKPLTEDQKRYIKRRKKALKAIKKAREVRMKEDRKNRRDYLKRYNRIGMIQEDDGRTKMPKRYIFQGKLY